MTEQTSQVDMYAMRYQRHNRVIEIIGRGKTAEAAFARYLYQLKASGVDVTNLTFLSARQLRRIGQKP